MDLNKEIPEENLSEPDPPLKTMIALDESRDLISFFLKGYSKKSHKKFATKPLLKIISSAKEAKTKFLLFLKIKIISNNITTPKGEIKRGNNLLIKNVLIDNI